VTEKQKKIYDLFGGKHPAEWVSPSVIATALDFPRASYVTDACARMVQNGILLKNELGWYRRKA